MKSWKSVFIFFLAAQLIATTLWITNIATSKATDGNFPPAEGIDNGHTLKLCYAMFWRFAVLILLWHLLVWGFFYNDYCLAIWLFFEICLNCTLWTCLILPWKLVPELIHCANPENSVFLTAYGNHNWPNAKKPALKACIYLDWQWNLFGLAVSSFVCIIGIITVFDQHFYRIPCPFSKSPVRQIKGCTIFMCRCCGRIRRLLLPNLRKLPTTLLLQLQKIFSKLVDKPEFWLKRSKEVDSEKGAVDLMRIPSAAPTGNSGFEGLVTNDDLFFVLCEFLHGRDIWALAAVSKTTKMTVEQHWEHNRNTLKKRLCPNSPRRCRYCDVPVCEICKPGRYKPFGRPRRVIEQRLGRPVCSWCYFLGLCGGRNVFTSLAAICESDHGKFKDFGKDPCQICARHVKSPDDGERIRIMKGADLDLPQNDQDDTNCCICLKKIWMRPMKWSRCAECGKERQRI